MTKSEIAKPLQRIDKLTELQKAKFPDLIKKWTNLGLSTELPDWKVFKCAIETCYSTINLKSPIILRATSPLASIYLVAIILRAQEILGNKKTTAVDSAVGSAVGSAVDNAVGSAVRNAVYNRNYLPKKTLDHALKNRLNNFWGRFNAGWQAYIDFYRQENLELTIDIWKIANAYRDAQMNCGWWYPFTGFVVASLPPVEIHLDEQGRLHHSNTMAIRYADNWGVFAWHGIRITLESKMSWIITNPEKITFDLINKEENAEYKRVMIERLGMAEYLKQSNAILVDENIEQATGNIRQLYRAKLVSGLDALFLKLINSTPEPDGVHKEYIIPVHPECRPIFPDDKLGDKQELTALNAVASSFGLYGHEYCPQIET